MLLLNQVKSAANPRFQPTAFARREQQLLVINRSER
jgi:hypothetical protein